MCEYLQIEELAAWVACRRDTDKVTTKKAGGEPDLTRGGGGEVSWSEASEWWDD